jgi:hydrogenase expression/formation protein HypC
MCLAIPGKIESIHEGDDAILRTGSVNFGGILKDVSLACVPDAVTGDYVLVHAGVAINTIDELAAQEIFAYLERIDEFGKTES